MSTSRREFLKAVAVSGAVAGAGGAAFPMSAFAGDTGKAKKPLKLLILGGTGFLGPPTVRTAVARGHEMTLFNRGKSNPHLFPDLEKLVGDRYSDISALEGRKWDAVIDTFAYVPSVVEESVNLLKENIGQYVLISSISVYADRSKMNLDETDEVEKVPDEALASIKTHREVGAHYGGMKALCEQAAEKLMPGRVCNIRPGLIVGPGDPSDRFTYWPVRVDRGGEVLAPGTPKDPVQFIDVRDLGAWIIHCIEKKYNGVYNATSVAGKNTVGSMLRDCKKGTGSDATFTYVGADFLASEGVEPWSHMPVWVPPDGEYAGFGTTSAEKAVKHGLVYRPVPDTARDTVKWFKEQSEERQQKMRAGLPAEREKEVLAAFKKYQQEQKEKKG